jgi:hypothetical protein
MSGETIAGRDGEPEIQRALIELRTWAAAAPEYDVDAGAQRFRTTLALPTEPPPEPNAAIPATAPRRWAVGVAIAACLVVGVGAIGVLDQPASPATSRGDHASPSTDSPPDSSARAAEPRDDPPPAVESTAPNDAPDVQPPADPSNGPLIRDHKPRRPSRSRAPRAAPPSETAPSVELPPTELALVRRMRAAMVRDPDEALRIAETLDALYPTGLLLVERAALVVFALDAAGRTDQARAAARRFLAAHPGSAFTAEVTARLGIRAEDLDAREAPRGEVQ